MDDGGLLDREKAAEYLGVSPATVRLWQSKGSLVPRGRGPRNSALYSVEDLDRARSEHPRPGRVPTEATIPLDMVKDLLDRIANAEREAATARAEVTILEERLKVAQAEARAARAEVRRSARS